MAVSIAAFPQFLDSNGNPLSGGLVESFEAGTTTPLSTFTSRDADVANSNPVVLDADGRAQIWLTANVPYKLVLKNAFGVIQDTIDNYYGGADPEQLQVAGIVPATGGTYTGPVDFTGGATFSGTPTQDAATLNSLGIASVQNANLWINPEGSLNQRSTSSVVDGDYGADRIIHLAQTGSTGYNIFDTAGLAMGGSALRLTQPDASPKRIGFCQIVEGKDCLAYRGKNLVFALQLRASAAVTVRVAMVAWTGTQDLPTRDVVNNWNSATYTAGNFFVANTQTIAVTATPLATNTWTDVEVSSISAGGVVAPLTMKNLYLVVWTDTAVPQNFLLDMTAARCGQGTQAQLWTPPLVSVELAKCRRYYQTIAVGYQAPVTVSGIYGGTAQLPVEMRASPGVSWITDNGNTNFPLNGLFLTVIGPGWVNFSKIASNTGNGFYASSVACRAELGV